MPVVSTIKPEQEEQNKIQKFPYEDRTYQSYVENGFEDEIPDSVKQIHEFETKFHLGLDLKTYQNDFKRIVHTITRFKTMETGEEVLIYYERWEGKNFLGNALPPILDHWEGFWIEQTRIPKYREGSDSTIIDHYEMGIPIKHYTIPWNKENLQKIYDSCWGPAQHRILYHFDGKPLAQNDYAANKEQFENLNYEQCVNIILQHGGFMAKHVKHLEKEDEIKGFKTFVNEFFDGSGNIDREKIQDFLGEIKEESNRRKYVKTNQNQNDKAGS